MSNVIPRLVATDPLAQARRREHLTRLLAIPDAPDLPHRGVQVRYALPVNRQALLVWLHQAYAQHRLLAARGEV